MLFLKQITNHTFTLFNKHTSRDYFSKSLNLNDPLSHVVHARYDADVAWL